MDTHVWVPVVNELKRAIALKDRAATVAAVNKLLDIQAPLGENWRSFCELMRISGELNLAHRAMDAFASHMNNAPQALYSKAVLFTQSGKMREAYELVASLPSHIPDKAGHEYVLGNAAMTLGLIDEARDRLTKAVKLRPGWGPAWLTLSAALNYATAPLAKRLVADKKAAEKQAPGDLARYFYALGKMHSDQGKYSAAFTAYAKGASLLKGETPYSRQANEQNALAARTGFAGELIATLNAQQQRDTSRPIFVTGLPRSGTTLVEQILTSHSKVSDGAELNLVQHLGVMVGGNSGEALQQFINNGGSADDLATHYLHLLGQRFSQPGRIVDKTVDASRFIGLVAAALPDAPLIWMRRDPLDSAWSCFRTFFIHGVAWSYDLQDIAHHFMLEDALLVYWKEQLGKRLLVVPYTELIDDPQSWTRKLLEHCGLDEEPAVFEPHTTKRVVMTASALQVRKPINREGLNVAAKYAAHLQEFIEAYKPLP